jgi:rare lipoprotein A (peptidoglycan hydrolase)
MKTHHFLAIAAILALASCARPAYEQRGFASYIADHYAGHHTSSGDIYSPYGWTAAHQVLPFGTQVKVKNNYNGRSVNLTVNDRFPAYPGRIINVSRAAAEYLQIPQGQMADVTVTAKTIPGMMPPQQQAPAYSAAPPPSYGATPPPSYNTRPPTTSAPPANYNAPPPNLTPPPVFNEAPPPGYGMPRAQ